MEHRWRELEVAEALGLAEADKRPPHERDRDFGANGLVPHTALLKVEARDVDRPEHGELARAALAVEIGHVVLHLEEAKARGGAARIRHEARPEVGEQRLGGLQAIQAVFERVLQRAFFATEDGVDERLFTREASVKRARADLRGA